MAQNINDNLRLHAPKLLDDKAGPYASVAAALAGIPAYQRCPGLEVVIEVGGVQKKYWFDGGIADIDLVEMPSGGSGGYEPKNSIEVDADELQLVGDEASPGNSKYYGTDGAGAKGFHDLPAGGTATPPKQITTLTYNDDGYVIQVIYTYVGTADTFEERFEYTDNQVTKKESKDTLASTWVQTLYVWTDNELGVPSYADILDWTILIP